MVDSRSTWRLWNEAIMRYLLLLLLLTACAQPKEPKDTYQYQCQSPGECFDYCQMLYPDSSLYRKQCYAIEMDRLNDIDLKPLDFYLE